MRVLVTRPEDAARRTANRLKDLGHQPVLMPLFQAEYLSVDMKSDNGDCALVFTSAHAVAAVEQSGLTSEVQNVTVFTVGKKTAAAARKAGFANVQSANGGGAELADLIHNTAPDRPLIYYAGEPRSPALENQLITYGIRFSTIVCYRMMPVAYTATEFENRLSPAPEAILLYSQETARRFFDLAAAHNVALSPSTRFLCLSPNIAATVPFELKARTFAAIEPSEDKLFSLL
ncbi:uroporphyrinogen-III synthase [Rhizobium sp. L1K21]|uniref:uroporphyrinogen-III synthase n=1 Tax=Rhizobium sp. L1K21 TaxID=2954933 RepID=UPI0020927726|nr:uroporphyrinogen-III synthase [Rhizobium sp. L1K21]MCO6184871.1 uroporphyrinogen-III synthase [Rhizobium sp. L1K21]